MPIDAIDVAEAQALAEDAKARLAQADAGDEAINRFRAERDLAYAENLLGIASR